MYSIDVSQIDALQKAMKEYQGNTEETINDVLHNYAGDLMQESIKKYMPVSGADWRGKKKAAKHSKSLKNVNTNLAVTVTTTKNYHYLYFPDDGTNTKRHIGNQQFFRKGGEAVQDDIINRCIISLAENFDKGV